MYTINEDGFGETQITTVTTMAILSGALTLDSN